MSVATGTLGYVADNWSPLTIGNGKWNGTNANRAVSGTIDEVAVYTNLLSASRIAAHYSTGTNAAPLVSYKQTVLNDHPLVYYRMDNPVYTAPSAGASPMAVNYGATTVEGAYLPGTVPGGVAGPTNSGWGPTRVACAINGIFSCVDAGYHPAFNPTNNAQTFSALIWFKGNPADSSMQALMSRGSNSWSLDLNGATGFLIWNSGAGSATAPTIYNDGKWHQAAGVYDGAHNYLYVDGSLVGSSVASGRIVGSTNDIYLGGDPDYMTPGVNERYFGGAIAQAAFFTNALSAAQVQSTYKAATTPSLPTFSAWNESGGVLDLSWTYGTLQTATNVTGPYEDLERAISPFSTSMTNGQQYFRIRGN